MASGGHCNSRHFVATVPSPQSLPPSSCRLLLDVSLCLFPLLYSSGLVIGLKVHPNPGLSHLEILPFIISAKSPFPNKIVFTGTRV